MRTPMLTFAVMCASFLAAVSTGALAQATPGGMAAEGRVIVKYKADAPALRAQALAVRSADAERADRSARASALGGRMGLGLRAGAGVAERTVVMSASGIGSEQLAQRLAADPEVEYAVPDRRRRALAAPNDPLYATAVISGGTGGPVSGQWYLRAPAGAVQASLNVEPAWNLTTGSPSIVVAVLDTGIRFDHPDLKRVADGGNLLPGYDMIGQHDGNFLMAGDNDGRDADPSDPGDWITAAETTQPGGQFEDCSVAHPAKQDSSWHGTQTAGLIGALTGNGIGMAGVGRTVRVLPVRVLGKCGGFDSDIIAGMRWAAGLSTGDASVPANPNPARVINMSLGGDGACTAAYQDAVAAINAAGTTVVASAGNSSGHAVSSPANCSGVIAVAGLRHIGTKVGFSDLGSQISISAPGGNCVNLTGACQFPILTTSNTGLTTPVAGAAGATFTDSFNFSAGTSFSSPLVAGAAALMLSANPALSPAEIRSYMRSTARPFPTSGADAGTPQCVAPQPIGQTQVNQGECYCTTATCGAGMLDAGASVSAVVAAIGLQARIAVVSAAPQALQAVTLSAATSTLPSGRSIATYAWVLTDGGGIVVGSLNVSADGSTATTTPTGAGRFSVTVTVTDNTGATSTASSTVTVAAAPVVVAPPASGAESGGGGGGALGAGWLVLLALAVLALARAQAQRGGARPWACRRH